MNYWLGARDCAIASGYACPSEVSELLQEPGVEATPTALHLCL
jgi:hypothetical protein